jgi:pimeloyl-ACP methyl ester carboxylesterase
MQDCKEFLLDIGDVELSIIEWAGTGDPILLLHATGFHSRCWNQVVKHLPGRHIYAADLRFHGASGDTGDTDWRVMAEDVRLLIEQLELTRLVGVGHSIGGHLIARAAAQAPERFKHLVLIDPVIMSPERYTQFQLFSGGLQAKDHPVSRRKNQWRDAQEMYERFQGRAPFNTWQPAVLRDYCDYALRPADNDALRQLACDPINEAGIYVNQKGNETILTELPRIKTPVTLLRAPPGDDSLPNLSTSPTWPSLAAALPNCREIYLPQLNHFIPMQDPALVADYIQATPW